VYYIRRIKEIIMRIGYTSEDYPEIRNIIRILDDVEYVKVWNALSKLSSFVQGINRKFKREIIPTADLDVKFYDFNLNKVSLLHFHNLISYGQIPWITTFETILPRFFCSLSCHHGSEPSFSILKHNRGFQRAVELLSSDKCKRIIAMSRCNAEMQKQSLKEFPEYKEKIEKKLIVMHPPQKKVISKYSEKELSLEGALRFMFVGTSFFQKGGMEIIETFKKLRDEYNYKIQLTIISMLNTDSYATKTSPGDVRKAKNSILQNRDWIDYYPYLPNNEVLTFMKKSHVGLLPTYADTYGYSVLEFQSAGCPVITTNIRALPEINDNNRGWVIEIRKNQLGEAIYITEEDRLLLSNQIRTGLERIIHEIFSNRNEIITKANNSLSGINENHSIENFAKRMCEIYLDAI
jgi:glycosyltransferase involved in cell wall biosynthesis